MTLKNKVKWVLGILVVFLLILATNLIDRRNFEKVKDSVSHIYEDRLVAKDLVFEMSLLIHEKEIAHLMSDSSYWEKRNEAVNNKIKELVSLFLETEMTDVEARNFSELEADLDKLRQYEPSSSKDEFTLNKPKISTQLAKVQTNLYELSKIQLEEGKKQVFISQKAMDTVELFTDIEIYFLILLAVAIQVVVIYKPN
ncbi:MAG: MCP four helix bundle domain-containing protein [Bacteroidia bacterium]